MGRRRSLDNQCLRGRCPCNIRSPSGRSLFCRPGSLTTGALCSQLAFSWGGGPSDRALKRHSACQPRLGCGGWTDPGWNRPQRELSWVGSRGSLGGSSCCLDGVGLFAAIAACNRFRFAPQPCPCMASKRAIGPSFGRPLACHAGAWLGCHNSGTLALAHRSEASARKCALSCGPLLCALALPQRVPMEHSPYCASAVFSDDGFRRVNGSDPRSFHPPFGSQGGNGHNLFGVQTSGGGVCLRLRGGTIRATGAAMAMCRTLWVHPRAS